MNFIEQYGWNSKWEEKMTNKGLVGRVLLEHKHSYKVITNEGEWLCSLSGRFKFDHNRDAYPAVCVKNGFALPMPCTNHPI